MTEIFTEQWKSGTLREGWYYILFTNEKLIGIDGCTDSVFWHTDNKILKVLAPVPSYDQFSQLAKKVEELTTKCSQLEKKVKKRGMQIERAYDRYVAKRKENSELVQKIHILEEQLDIAVKALEGIERKSDKFDNSLGFIEQLDYIKADCQATLYYLKEVDEVKND